MVLDYFSSCPLFLKEQQIDAFVLCDFLLGDCSVDDIQDGIEEFGFELFS
jgi:hypothetical protein